jgi:hypothetical protein
MPKAIESLTAWMTTERFKKATLYKEFTSDEIQSIQQFVDTVGLKNAFKRYGLFCTIISHDVTNLLERWKYLTTSKDNTSLRTHIARHGEHEGKKRYAEYGEKQRESNSFEYKQQKFGWTTEQFKEYNKSRSVTLEKCIQRHGTEKGLDLWNNYVERQRYTNSLEYYKEKYAEEGHEKWLAYNQEKAKSSKVTWVMEKYQVTFDEAVEIIGSRAPTSHTSIAEVIFVDNFEKLLGTPVPYSVKTKQFCIWNHYVDGPCFYDLADSSRKKIIEFHGDYWHCNPIKYNSEYVITQNGMTAKQIWERDNLKRQAALDRGFQIMVVWHSDFEARPDQIIEECVTWWNSN